jgi:hypothetical protein
MGNPRFPSWTQIELVLERLGRKLGGLRSCHREEFRNSVGKGSDFGRWHKQSERPSFVWRKKK